MKATRKTGGTHCDEALVVRGQANGLLISWHRLCWLSIQQPRLPQQPQCLNIIRARSNLQHSSTPRVEQHKTGIAQHTTTTVCLLPSSKTAADLGFHVNPRQGVTQPWQQDNTALTVHNTPVCPDSWRPCQSPACAHTSQQPPPATAAGVIHPTGHRHHSTAQHDGCRQRNTGSGAAPTQQCIYLLLKI